MEITELAAERTTAATDLLLGILTLAAALFIYQLGRKSDRTKGMIWSAAFGLMSIASFFGAIAHGFVMSFETNLTLWQPVNASLGLAVALFVIGVMYDLRGFWISKGLTVSILLLGAIFYFFTWIFENLFVVFIVYEAIALIFSLAVYVILALKNEVKGAILMVIGILISLIAAAVQTNDAIRFDLLFTFDNNSVFHFLQMFGIGFLFFGLRRDLKYRTV